MVKKTALQHRLILRSVTSQLTALLFLCLAHNLEAQVGYGSFQGKIVEASSESPLEFATISVYATLDDSLLSGDLSAGDGTFSISLPYGEYYAKINFIGLEERVIDSIQIDLQNTTFDLGEIRLHYQSEFLEVVEVVGERELVHIALDRRIYNVGKDLANAGGSAIDVLDNLPSVAVELGGALTLRGSQGVQILIDGKPSGLVSNGNATGLQSLSADLIERVEIITNPSVKYEAEGTAGIINIVLKKEKKYGINGAASVSAARPKALNAALSLNAAGDKINVFSNLSFNDYLNLGVGSALQEAYLPDGTTEIFQSTTINNIGGPSGNFRIGSDFNFNKNTTLTTTVTYFIADEDHFSQNTYNDFQGDLNSPIGGSRRTEDKETFTERQEFTGTFKKTFGDNKQELVANVQINRNSDEINSDFLEIYFLANGQPSNDADLLQRAGFLRTENRFLAKLDYLLPVNDKTKLEMGWQSRIRTITNDYFFEDYLSEEWIIAEDFTDIFEYAEKIHGAYALYKKTLTDLSFQVGLRSEYSSIETSLPSRVQKNYLNLFPSAHLSYSFPNSNSIQASYSRRIRRPRAGSLNPYIALTDNRAFASGNPELEPEWTDVYELGHLKKWDKGSIGSFLFYRHTTNVIEGVVRQSEIDGVPVFFRQPDNLNSKDDVGLEFNISYRPLKQWRISSDFFLYRAVIDGSNISDEIRSEAFTGRGRLTSKVTFFKTLDLQGRVNVQAPMNTPQGRRRSMIFLDLTLSTKLLNDKAKLILNVLDVFTSRRIRNQFSTENLFRENDYLWNKTRVRVSFNYRIGE